MGLVANQACSPEDGGEHKNPANLLETLWFQVSPPVKPIPTYRSSRIRDSSETSELVSDPRLSIFWNCRPAVNSLLPFLRTSPMVHRALVCELFALK